MGSCGGKTIKTKEQEQKKSIKLLKVECEEEEDVKMDQQITFSVEQINLMIMNMWIGIQQSDHNAQLITLRNSTDQMVKNSLKRINRRNIDPSQEILKDVVFANILFQQLEKISNIISDEMFSKSQFDQSNPEIISQLDKLNDDIIDFGVRFKSNFILYLQIKYKIQAQTQAKPIPKIYKSDYLFYFSQLMNQQEQEKFNQIISSGYKELIVNRPQKPLEHFIHYLLSKLPEEMRNKDEVTLSFFKNYQENELKVENEQ